MRVGRDPAATEEARITGDVDHPFRETFSSAGCVRIILGDLGEKLPVSTVVSACPSILL
jgi:hypothetical protein